MFKKFLPVLLLAGFSLQADMVPPELENINPMAHHSGSSSSHHHHGIRTYAAFSNQAAVITGENIPWTINSFSSAGFSVDGTGDITLPKTGIYLVQYTVRLTRTPFDGTSTATVQLQQTVSGVPTNITQSSVTSNTSIDGITDDVPESQTQITGYALVNVTATTNNVLNLAVTLTGGGVTIPATTGLDANAELVILHLN